MRPDWACHRFATSKLVNEPNLGQAIQAAFAQLLPLMSSYGNRRCAQPVDCCKYAVEEATADRDLGQLECDGSCVADYPCTDFEQPGLKAGQRPVGHPFG